MQSWKEWALPVITTMGLWQLMHFGTCSTWSTSCVQVHELPQIYSGDNREGTLLSWLRKYNIYIYLEPYGHWEGLWDVGWWLYHFWGCDLTRLYIYIYIYICNYEKNESSQLSTQWVCGNSYTLAHDLHHVPKCMSWHKSIVVMTGKAHCFHDCINIIYTYI